MISERMISDNMSPQMKLNAEYGYPHSYVILQFCLKLEHFKPRYAACHQTKCEVINDVKLFPTVYRRIYCGNFLMLSNQTSHTKASTLE